MGTNSNAYPAHLRAATLPAARLAFLPAEHLHAAIERLLHERARHVKPRAIGIRRPVDRFTFRRVDTTYCNLIETELFCRFRDDRLHDAVALHRAWRTLLRSRRRVRQDVDRSPAH